MASSIREVNRGDRSARGSPPSTRPARPSGSNRGPPPLNQRDPAQPLRRETLKRSPTQVRLSRFRQNATVAHFVVILRKGRQRSIAGGTTFQRFVGDSVRERGGGGVAGAPARLEQFGAGPATKRPTMPGPIHACHAAAVADACPRFRNRPRLTKLELAADDRIAVATIRSIQPTGWPGESRHGDGVTVLGTPADQFYRRLALGYAAVERLVWRG
jgi:hypothetical protein